MYMTQIDEPGPALLPIPQREPLRASTCGCLPEYLGQVTPWKPSTAEVTALVIRTVV